MKHEDAFIRSFRFEFAATLKTAIKLLPHVLCYFMLLVFNKLVNFNWRKSVLCALWENIQLVSNIGIQLISYVRQPHTASKGPHTLL